MAAMDEKTRIGQMVLRTVAKWRDDRFANPEHFLKHVTKTTGKIAGIFEAADHQGGLTDAQKFDLLEKHLPDLIIESCVMADSLGFDERVFNGKIFERGEDNASKKLEPPKPVGTLNCAQFPRHPPLEGTSIFLNGNLYDVVHVCTAVPTSVQESVQQNVASSSPSPPAPSSSSPPRTDWDAPERVRQFRERLAKADPPLTMGPRVDDETKDSEARSG